MLFAAARSSAAPSSSTQASVQADAKSHASQQEAPAAPMQPSAFEKLSLEWKRVQGAVSVRLLPRQSAWRS